MGDINQLLLANQILQDVTGDVLEVGSKDYGNTQSFRNIFKNCQYTGVDLEPGQNVDLVANLEEGVEIFDQRKFDLIIICSVLEHTPKPWILASNLEKLLSNKGIIYSCHPWVWRYHKYPEDYYRFSPKAIQTLFPKLTHWLPQFYSTTVQGEFLNFTENNFIDNEMAVYNNNGRKYLPYLQTIMVGTANKTIFEHLQKKLESSLQSRSSNQ